MRLVKKSSASFRGFTDFQLRVLEATLKIPFGQVRTYSWIARRVGSPGAARAVGSALRKNQYPLLIPCHRVVKSDGALGRYSGGKGVNPHTKDFGVGVKRKLIEFEKRLENIFCLNHKKEVSLYKK